MGGCWVDGHVERVHQERGAGLSGERGATAFAAVPGLLGPRRRTCRAGRVAAPGRPSGMPRGTRRSIHNPQSIPMTVRDPTSRCTGSSSRAGQGNRSTPQPKSRMILAGSVPAISQPQVGPSRSAVEHPVRGPRRDRFAATSRPPIVMKGPFHPPRAARLVALPSGFRDGGRQASSVLRGYGRRRPSCGSASYEELDVLLREGEYFIGEVNESALLHTVGGQEFGHVDAVDEDLSSGNLHKGFV